MNELNELFDGHAPHKAAIEAMYGPLPSLYERCHAVKVHEWIGPAHRLTVFQVTVGEPAWLSWPLYCVDPLNAPSRQMLLSPDGCWPHLFQPETINTLLDQNISLAWFDRTQLAWDCLDKSRDGPVNRHWPETPWSAVAVWAWGIIQSITALTPWLDGQRIAVTGHSRGGKAALVAGSLDPHIAAVIPHNTGTGGMSSLQTMGAGAEHLSDLAVRFPHWLAPSAQNPKRQALLLDIDIPYHWLRAMAPKGLCVLQASDDLWANPKGTEAMVQKLACDWSATPQRLQLHTRRGGHAMSLLDWQRAAGFLSSLDSHGDQSNTDESA